MDSDSNTELAACTYFYDIEDPGQSGGYVYLLTTNQRGVLVLDNGWTSNYKACYQCLRWADVDGDGDMDLVAGTSLILDENTPVMFFCNQGTSLSATPTFLVTNQAWDVLDIEWGDFNFDNLPDLLIVRTDGPPMVIPGQSNGSGGWTVLGSTLEELEIAETSVIPSVVNRAMETDIWDVNSDGFLDIVFSTTNATCELVSNPTNGDYTIPTEIGRGFSFSEAVAYVPSISSSTGRVSILKGNAWDEGVGGVFDFISENFSPLLPDEVYFNIEYVSSFALLSAYDESQTLALYLAVAEAGFQDSPIAYDPRFRCARILRLDPTQSGWSAIDVWKEGDEERGEAFSVAWADLSSSSPQQVDISMQGSGHLFSLGGSNQYAYHRPVCRIESAFYRDGMAVVPVHCWFSGNGWIGTRESIPSGKVFHVVIQTFAQPDLFFGRRGCIEGYDCQL
jgi:hypothetical protein